MALRHGWDPSGSAIFAYQRSGSHTSPTLASSRMLLWVPSRTLKIGRSVSLSIFHANSWPLSSFFFSGRTKLGSTGLLPSFLSAEARGIPQLETFQVGTLLSLLTVLSGPGTLTKLPRISGITWRQNSRRPVRFFFWRRWRFPRSLPTTGRVPVA